MTTLEKVRDLLPAMSPGEKAQVLSGLRVTLAALFQGLKVRRMCLVANPVLYVRVFQYGFWCRQGNLAVVRPIF